VSDKTPPVADPVSAADRVYDAIYAAVIDHRLVPGTRLREEELAQTFAVSRTLVRQALHKLAQDGVILLRPNKGAMVPEPTRRDGEHVFDARRVVDFVRLLEELLPTTSLLMALYKAPGEPMCVAHSHRQMLAVLAASTGAAAATEMRRHLNEIERSLSQPATRKDARLRDVFKAYKAAA
jgi:DNA-binding GntR family transcriptional regulator